MMKKIATISLFVLLASGIFAQEKGVVISKNTGADGRIRNFFWYLPGSYSRTVKSPLLIFLHDKVVGSYSENLKLGYPNNLLIQLSEKSGYILLCPVGDENATWFDSSGISILFDLIEITGKKYNIDNNRIFLSGFGDGASATFLIAMTQPDRFAGFIPLSGHPVSSFYIAKKQAYLTNFSNTPFYIVNTVKDDIAPVNDILPVIELIRQAGGNIIFKSHENFNHTLFYLGLEFSDIIRFIEGNERILFPDHIVWETSDPAFGRFRWISIDKISSSGHTPEYRDYNLSVESSYFFPGFIPSSDNPGRGVKVGIFYGGNSFFQNLGICQGDRILRINGKGISSFSDLSYESTDLVPGDPIDILVERNGKEEAISGKVPENRLINLLPRESASGKITARFSNNEFHIRTSQVDEFTIFIHPDMVDMDHPVRIHLNGTKLFDDYVGKDKKFRKEFYRKYADKDLIYDTRLTIRLQDQAK